MLEINNLRREYRLKPLDLSHLNSDPFLQFSAWFEEAQQAKVLESNAMALATVSSDGHPSCRTVLLKQVDARGFSFFTNYESRKGQELASNPFACATFYWAVLERQIIIEGRVEKLTEDESKSYFASRPRSSQLGAWASPQSQVVQSREELDKTYYHFEKFFGDKEIPLPPYWGGYRLIPHVFEFWQGRPKRMHDRFRYRLQDKAWIIERLAP